MCSALEGWKSSEDSGYIELSFLNLLKSLQKTKAVVNLDLLSDSSVGSGVISYVGSDYIEFTPTFAAGLPHYIPISAIVCVTILSPVGK
jgi:hypothetical protein